MKNIIFFSIKTFCFTCLTINCYSQSVRVTTYGVDDFNMSFHKAMMSSFDTVIVDSKKSPYVASPMVFKNIHDKVIVLEEGVNIVAKKGAFPNPNDALLMFLYCSNISILGNSGTLLMNKEEYIAGEWRHGISIKASRNMKIENIQIFNSGGDGIYIAGAKEVGFSENIVIDNLKSVNNKRQGLTIVSAKNVVIKNSFFANTKGILPGAGIDIEPNDKDNLIQGILIENCLIEDNYGAGIVIGLRKLENTSKKISIRINKSVIRRNHSTKNKKAAAEIIFGAHKYSPVKGKVVITNCLIEESNWGLVYSRKIADAYSVVFKDCMVRNLSKNSTSPIVYLEVPDYYNESGPLGGYKFENLYIQNKEPVSFLVIRGSNFRTLKGVTNISAKVVISGLRLELVEYINYNPRLNQNIVFESIEY